MPTEGQEQEGMPYKGESSDINHEIFKSHIPQLDIPDFFKLIIANSHMMGIIIMDKTGTILAMNSRINSSLGYSEEDLIGKHISVMAIPEDRLKNLPEMELASVFQKGFGTDRNFVLHKDGSHIWCHGESVFTKNDKGEVFVIKMLFDVNEQKLLEAYLSNSNKKLNETLEQLNRVNKDLETFVYTASHDLKAPVGNIEALISSLEEELTEECRQNGAVPGMIKMLNDSVSKLKATIEDLSLTGQVQHADNKTEILFPQMLEAVKIDLNDQVTKSQAIFTEDFSRADRIFFSKKNLRSILFNLVSNGIKYRSPDRRPHITIRTERTGEYVLLQVSDNGLGMKEEDKAEIFSLYKRLHTHVEGSGVGLSILAKIIENNGGRIEVDSKLGEGTTFKVYIREQ